MTMVPDTKTQLNDSWRILYAERLKKLQPEYLRYMSDIKAKKGRLGQSYNWPVVLKQEQGFTFSRGGNGEVTFRHTVPGIIKAATADGYQMFAWCGIDYETAAKGANSKQSFVDAVGHIVESLDLSAKRRQEMLGWYGQSGLGTVESCTYNNDADLTNDYIVITEATWAPGIWIGSEGMHLDILDSTLATKRNADAQHLDFVVTKVDMVNRRIYLNQVDNASTAAYTLVEADDLHDCVATDVVFMAGTRDIAANPDTWNEQMGIDAILTGQTTLFGITQADYTLWTPQSYTTTTALTGDAIQDIAAKAIPFGMEGTVNLYLNPESTASIIKDLGGLRRFTSQEGNSYKIGSNDIQVYCQGLLVKIVSHPYIKEGLGYMFNPEIFKRVQAYPLSSQVPGRGDDLFHLSDGKSSYSMQMYSNEVLTTDAPCQGVRISGIVN